MSSGGADCIDRGLFGTNDITIFVKDNPIDITGQIDRFCAYFKSGNPVSCKLKIFRQNGVNIDFVAESSIFIPNDGLNTWDISPLNVQSGDYVGIYVSGAPNGKLISYSSDGVGTFRYKLGQDVSSNSAENTWNSDVSASLSVKVNFVGIFVKLTGNDANSGGTWISAKQTLYGGITALTSGSPTLHIAFGDYSAQTSFTLNRNMYLFGEVDGGGGTGTITFPATV